MQSSSSNKHSKKRSTSSLSYRSAQNASYRLLDDERRKKRHSAEESQSGGHSGSRTKSAVPDNRYDTRNSRPPKRKKNRGCLGRILLPLILLILIIFALFFLFLRSAFNKVEKYELNMSDIVVNDKDDNMNNYQTIALFGVDNQDNKIKDVGSRTDTIIIVSINKSSKDVKLMSIYRDTYVSIDGEYDKINAAYAYGGPEQAINTINRNLDLNITDFATVNFKALADAVDILGGIELTIKSEKELENLNDYIGNMNKINGGDSPKFDEVGTYTFDGNQAVAYSRIRYMEGGDHERANHQRLVVEGIVKKVKQQPWKLKALADTVIPQCKTSLSTGDMTSLTMSLLRYSIVDSQAYPFESVDERYGGIYYGFPLTVYSNTVQAHEYLYGTKDYEPTEELGRISDKVEAVTDDLGY
ncbi:LCP family protein [Eubacterium sp. An3]|uniref:LCP family protein n=1 Tax=Eubacterium sp. An3 TaxID=1965628 RepID=UPI000B3A28C5|nr:LCP family protein [Eubacterium sp. An3]OUO30233.1 cell envelope-like function transcriptional attenuator common domain protein [Eubacterium sp. An3]